MKNIIALLCLLCCSLPVVAQKSGFLLQDIRLPLAFNQQIINCLEEDNAGFLWFVTNNGLYRYDGTDVIHLDKENDMIAESAIKTLFADQRGNLWIGTKNGLIRFNLNTWTATKMKSEKDLDYLSNYILEVSGGRDGTVYAGSLDGKVYKVASGRLIQILDINAAMPALYDLPNVTDIQEPYPGQLWIVSTAGKLIKMQVKPDGSYGDPVFYDLGEFNGERIINVTFGGSGKCLMVVPEHGLYVLNTKTGDFKKCSGKYGDLGVDGQVFMAPLDSSETLLLTNAPSVGKQKLLIYNFQKDTIVEQNLYFPGYLADNHITWFSHTGSMILLSLNEHLMELNTSKSPFETLMGEPKSLNSIRAIYKQPGGNLYVGSYKDGFVMLNEEKREKKVIARKYVYSILPWSKDSLLLSTEGDGLIWYEPGKDKLTPLHIATERTSGNPMGKYLTFLLRGKGKDQVMVGTNERLYMVNPYKRTARVIGQGRLARTRVLGLMKKGSDYFIATERGILKYSSITDSIMDFWNSELETHTGNITVYGMAYIGHQIWAGTGGQGILILNDQGKVLDTINQTGGLASDIVFTLTATNKYVLAGTKNGLSTINVKSGNIKNYSTLDLLPANEFNSAASCQLEDTIYLGTINGVVRFNTGALVDSVVPWKWQPLYISDITMTDHKGRLVHDYSWPYQQLTSLHIAAGTPYFSIDFGNMGGSSQSLNYYYRLQNNDQWSSLGAARKISFVGMTPGDYQLELTALLPDGSWTDTLLSVPMIVAAAFYQTVLFKVLIGLISLALVWSLIKYREKQVEKEKLLRLKIAGDLHDEVGSTLAGISMQADMLLNGHEGHTKTYLQNIAENGRLAVQTMGDIVWSIDSRNDDNVSLFQRMERYGQKVFGVSDISIRFHYDEGIEKQYISQQIRQNVMLIYKEALTNVIKHAEASQVDVSITSLNKGFKLAIADNGKGLAGRHLAVSTVTVSGHGLRNMRMRAKGIGADIEFPEVKKGVMIVLILKV